MALKLESKCVHLEEDELADCNASNQKKLLHYGAVSFPIYQSATFTHPAVGQSGGFDYSRLQNPTREHVEKIVCQLEGGTDALALSSGMAAISLLMEIFSPGDQIIVDADLYGGSIRLFENVSKKNGLLVKRADIASLNQEELLQIIGPQTKAIYIETPTNPMMNITDIAAVAKITRQKKILLIVDNTFMSPYFQNPLALGADIVVHSGTKYLSGHNDTLAGFVVTKRADIQEKLRFLIKTTGAGLPPFDSWLTIRGIKTLSLRMERAQENAKKIAAWLKEQKCVERVIYPGLPEHPGHKIQKKQARGFGAMVTFNLKNPQAAKSLLSRVKLIQFAESLGGVESLITYPVTQTHADVPEAIRLANGISEKTLRLSTGIENADDLIEDLRQAMEDL